MRYFAPAKLAIFSSVLTLSVLSVSTHTHFGKIEDGCTFPAIFNFGDSNSDTGGLSAAFFQLPWPYGVTFFHRRAGRFSDGRLVIDFLAESLGLPSIHAYLDAMRANFSNGVNFATAGSTIRPPSKSVESGYSPISLDVQLSQFTQFKSRSELDYNQEGVFKDLLPKEDFFSRALYTFDIGQNDLTISDFISMTKEEFTGNISAIMMNFATVVKEIYNSGGRFFWIHNTGPIGCLAYVLDSIPEDEIDEAGCSIEWNKLAQHFNKRLEKTVVQLRKDLPLGVLTYVDVYSIKYALFRQPKNYGLEEPLMVCCGVGGKYNYNNSSECGTSIVVEGTKTVVGACDDPSVRANWDGVHYTEAANQLVSDQIVTGAFSNPPIPLKMACSRGQPIKLM